MKHISGTKRRDWYIVDKAIAENIRGLPGARPYGDPFTGDFNVHRSMMALINHPEAESLRPTTSVQLEDWALRDAFTRELGFKLRTTQHQAIDFLTDSRRWGALLGDDMRLGKGHPAGTGVLTPSGWRAIDNLKIGDSIIGSDGLAYRVTGVYPRGALPVFRVTFADGASTVVDGEHLWAVWDHNAWSRGQPYAVKSTLSLINNLHYSNGNRKWRIPMVKPIEFGHRQQPIDPYLLGVLLGDGSLTSPGVVFTPGDEDVPKEIAKVLPSICRLVRSDSIDRTTNWRITGVEHGHNYVLDALRSLGVYGLTSEKKFVPQEYLFASVEQRIALLQGLMDTDGELSQGGQYVGFDSSSEALRDAVQFLVESLGGSARARIREEPKYIYKGEQRTGKPSYRLSIAMPAEFSPFRARQGYQGRPKYPPSRTIESIEACGVDNVYCISVDAPDQLYVTTRCIVTHNTLSAIMSHEPELGQLVVIAPLSTRAVWLGWLKRVFPNTPIGVITGKTFDPVVLDNPIVFGHYDIIHKWQGTYPIGTLVFDEAHLIGNKDTRRAKAAVVFRMRAQRVIAMTGTPIWNLPWNLWSVLSLITPGAFGGYHEFCNRYGLPVATGYGTKYTGLSNESELRARMGEIMLRRRWVDCADDLPPITRSVIVAELNQTERNKLDILAGKLKSERTNTIGNLAAYRKQITGIKMSTTVAEAKRILALGEPVVIWTWHVEYAEKIAKAIDRALVIHGDVAPSEREHRMQLWRESPTPEALVSTMPVAQVGIDLSHARHAIFAEIDYTPAIIGQAEMRTFAPDRPMSITFVIANHIVDQRITKALIHKLGASDPLGVAAATDAIDALREVVMGPIDEGSLDRLLEDLLASAA